VKFVELFKQVDGAMTKLVYSLMPPEIREVAEAVSTVRCRCRPGELAHRPWGAARCLRGSGCSAQHAARWPAPLRPLLPRHGSPYQVPTTAQRPRRRMPCSQANKRRNSPSSGFNLTQVIARLLAAVCAGLHLLRPKQGPYRAPGHPPLPIRKRCGQE
jgi:hypothetical protein